MLAEIPLNLLVSRAFASLIEIVSVELQKRVRSPQKFCQQVA